MATRRTAALEEVETLLLPGAEPELRLGGGYIDLFERGGERKAFGPHLGQRVFRSRLVPPIYERFWRPLVARSFFGRRGPRAEQEREITLDLLDVSPGERVLDVGCGPGNYTRHIAAAAGDGLVVGIDPSAAMVAAAARRGGGENLAYVCGDGAALPFSDDAFDAVCCVGVLHVIEDPTAALEQMVRVLAPGGRLVVVATCGPDVGRGQPRAGMHIFGREELTGALKARGLGPVEQQIVRHGQFVAARKQEA